MKKFLIILTFLFVSIFAYSDSAISYSKSVNIDFDVRVMMGLTKIEEKDNPKYKKFLNYIDENLVKKGEVKYSHKVNMDKKVVEFFSEKGEFLLAENLPKEFLDIVDRSIRVAENKEEIKKIIKNIYEDPYTYVSISKYKENLILFTEENMVNRGKIKNTISVVLKRELTDNEKNELIYLKDNNNDEFFNKYRTYIDSETTKTYINDKLELFQEIKSLTETTILYKKNEVSFFVNIQDERQLEDVIDIPKVKKIISSDVGLYKKIFNLSPEKAVFKLPSIVREEDREYIKNLLESLDKPKIMSSSYSSLNYEGFEIANYHLNCYNSFTHNFYNEKGVYSVASPENIFANNDDYIYLKDKKKLIIPMYVYPNLMLMEYCPHKDVKGRCKYNYNCKLPSTAITNEQKDKFLFEKFLDCKVAILPDKAYTLSKKQVQKYVEQGYYNFLIELKGESFRDIEKIVEL